MDYFRTSDTQLASYLVAIGHRLQTIEGPRERREFVFEASARSDSLGYFTDSARPIQPRRLFAAFRDLKHALYAVR